MDLNTLISNIVTSTAALVAIIGGFLISRVIITLSSGKTGVKRKLNEVKNDVFTKEEMFKKIEKDILDEDAEDFIDYNYKDLLFNEIYFLESHKGRIVIANRKPRKNSGSAKKRGINEQVYVFVIKDQNV